MQCHIKAFVDLNSLNMLKSPLCQNALQTHSEYIMYMEYKTEYLTNN